MKSFMLGIVSVGLLLFQGGWSAGAPVPADLTEVATLKLPRGHQASSLTFSPDGKILFGLVRGEIWLWDVASRKQVASLEHIGEGAGVGAGMVLSPDGSTLAAYRGKAIVLWDVADRKEIATLKQDGDVHAIVFSPDGKTLSAMIRNTDLPRRKRKPMFDFLQIWDVEKQKKMRICEVSSTLQSVSTYNSIKKPVLLERRTSLPIPPPAIAIQPTDTISFSLVDAFTGERVVTCEWSRKEAPQEFLCALNRDETMLATSGFMSPIQLWDRKSGKRIAIFKEPAVLGLRIAFSPDGKILAAAYRKTLSEHGLLLFEVPSGKVLADRQQNRAVDCLAFSPAGRLMATGEVRGLIQLWRIPERWRKEN